MDAELLGIRILHARSSFRPARRPIRAVRHPAVTGASGTVRHAVEQCLGGELQGAEPCSTSLGHDHQESSVEEEYEEDEVGRLREEVGMLQQQLREAMKRVDGLTPN